MNEEELTSGVDATPSTSEHEAVDPSSEGADEAEFDFVAHRQAAIEAYRLRLPTFKDYAQAVYAILKTRLDTDGIKVHSIEHRAKTLDSYGDKAQSPSDAHPTRPKYDRPLDQIMDLAGVRVITYFLSTEAGIDTIIVEEFDVLEKTDKSDLLQQEERLGYQSVHYLVALKENRRGLPEYATFAGLVAEIQVRTILQHAWAEIEHDIQYKAATALPAEVRRRFMTLAGLLEVADREFQAIQDDSQRLKDEARESVAAGRLGEVEITPDALKAYLDRQFGPDGRMSEFSYEWQTRLLRKLGFTDLRQVDEAITPFDDDYISRVVHGSRQGQLTRFDDVLIAAMGEEFLRRHPFANSDDNGWYVHWVNRRMRSMRDSGVSIGTYRPEEAANTGLPQT